MKAATILCFLLMLFCLGLTVSSAIVGNHSSTYALPNGDTLTVNVVKSGTGTLSDGTTIAPSVIDDNALWIIVGAIGAGIFGSAAMVCVSLITTESFQ